MTPALAGVATLTVGLTVVVIAIWVGTRSASADPTHASPVVYRMRNYYSAALVLVFLGAGIKTLPFGMYGARAGEVVVNATGSMWAWKLEGAEQGVPAGKPIEFRVTSIDVNHGFGIYNEQGELLAQTQAMPRYENRLVYTFEQPGRYRVVCLEFCGLMHHGMSTDLEVR